MYFTSEDTIPIIEYLKRLNILVQISTMLFGETTFKSCNKTCTLLNPNIYISKVKVIGKK